MGNLKHLCKSIAAAFLVGAWGVGALAQDAPAAQDIDSLLAELADPETRNWEQVERKIRLEWSKSGSAAMDLLLQRGRKAMEAEDWTAAVEHFTALTDHAPDFAEGWYARGTVYFRQKLYGPALSDIGTALSLNANHFGALSGLAVLLEEMGMEKNALEAWRMLEKINPHRPETQDALIRLGAVLGDVPI